MHDRDIAENDGTPRQSAEHVPFTGVHRLVRRFLEPALDVLIVALALGLLGVMIRALITLGAELIAPNISFRGVMSEALFLFLLVEVQRLIIIYLRDHHVSVDMMVEVTIVAVLREIVLLNALAIEPLHLLAITLFLLALGTLLRFGDLRAPRGRVRQQGASMAAPGLRARSR